MKEASAAVEADQTMMAALEEAEEVQTTMALEEAAEEVELAMKWEVEAAEEAGHQVQVPEVQVSPRLVGVEVELAGQHFHSVPVLEVGAVVAFQQLQHSRRDRKNLSGSLSEVAAEGRLNAQAVEVVPKQCACPRKAAGHRICLTEAGEIQHRPP